MMGRVPVARTLASAYGLLFGRFFSTLGLVWLPAAFLGLSLYFDLTRLVVHITAIGSADLTTRLALAGAGLFAFVVALVLLAAIAVPVAREALGRREGRVAAHFVLGGRELGLAAAQIRFYLLLLGTVFAVAAVTAIAVRFGLSQFADASGTRAGLATWRGLPILSLTEAASGLAGAIASILVAVRLGFFLIPIAALEDKVRLVRALEISRRNLGRVIATSVWLLLPVGIVVLGVADVLYGAKLTGAFHVSVRHDFESVLVFVLGHAAALSALAAVTLTLVTVLFATASAAAYQALAPARAAIAEWHRNEIREGPDLPPQKEKPKRKDEGLVSSESSPLQGDLVFAAEERIAALAEDERLKRSDHMPSAAGIGPSPAESEPTAIVASEALREAVDASLAADVMVHPLATFHSVVETQRAEQQEQRSDLGDSARDYPVGLAHAAAPPTLMVPEECPVSSTHEQASEEAWEKMAAAAVQAAAAVPKDDGVDVNADAPVEELVAPVEHAAPDHPDQVSSPTQKAA